ncbi:MAG: UDP-glucose 4-epimerase GalE [Deferribacteraceae bacterium]|jgi:UDP-glucose 4-epimerase|nr:UDP-glucose 4-epimerase GalE [Deferribacteraceae bacterium]
MKEFILVTGGAGYIGSHTVQALSGHGYIPIVYDNLSEGHRQAVDGNILVVGDTADAAALNELFSRYNFSAVIHFAASSLVGESVVEPAKYYSNNLAATITLLSAALKFGVKNFIFSSTCATYGCPVYTPIDEKHPQLPINPYGSSKLMVEMLLRDYNKGYGLNYAILRYFNAAGAHPHFPIGESHRRETHLIPLILKTLLKNSDRKLTIFGEDYDTPDGTCIRDYIHVTDLAEAHISAMQKLLSSSGSFAVNLAVGRGCSVKEAVKAAEDVTGLKVPLVHGSRREGDPPVLVADNLLAKELLGFSPKYTDIREIIQTAWNWELNRRF